MEHRARHLRGQGRRRRLPVPQLLIVVGLVLCLAPVVSNLYWQQVARENVSSFTSTADSRDTHSTGQNSSMRVTGTTHGDKSQNLGLVQLQGFRRSQIVRCQNNRNIRVDSSVHNTQQIIQNPLGHILDVRSTSLHICIIHSCKHSCKLDACLFHGVFCITGFFINQRCNTL